MDTVNTDDMNALVRGKVVIGKNPDSYISYGVLCSSDRSIFRILVAPFIDLVAGANGGRGDIANSSHIPDEILSCIIKGNSLKNDLDMVEQELNAELIKYLLYCLDNSLGDHVNEKDISENDVESTKDLLEFLKGGVNSEKGDSISHFTKFILSKLLNQEVLN